MNSKPTKAESDHMARVKSVACSFCNAPPPSEAHHIEQGKHFITVAACGSCHRDEEMGIHGRRRMMKITKIDELTALDITLQRVSQLERKV